MTLRFSSTSPSLAVKSLSLVQPCPKAPPLCHMAAPSFVPQGRVEPVANGGDGQGCVVRKTESDRGG
eukprot:6243277-Lingulodinium_polyedra.AAC.1